MRAATGSTEVGKLIVFRRVAPSPFRRFGRPIVVAAMPRCDLLFKNLSPRPSVQDDSEAVIPRVAA